MSSLRYIASADVRHVAVWVSGWRALCSPTAERQHPLELVLSPRYASTRREQRHLETIGRRPVCRDCMHALASILGDLARDEHDVDALSYALLKLSPRHFDA